MSVDYYKRLIVTMDNYHRDELLKTLQQNNFTVAGFKDIKKANENHILGALKKSIKNKESYINSIVEIYPDTEKYDVAKLGDEEYIQTIVNEENKQGVIALIIKEIKPNEKIIEKLVEEYLPIEEVIEDKEIDKKDSIADEIIQDEINSLKSVNKQQHAKIKKITEQIKQKETIIYSQKDTIEKNQKEINKLSLELDKLNTENKKLLNTIDSQRIILEEVKQKNNILEIKCAQKTILIIGMTSKIKTNKHFSIIVKDEEILQNISILDVFLDVFYEIWVIESEISSYTLKLKLIKEQRSNHKLKLFKNPSEIKLYVGGIDKNGIL